MSTDRMNIPVGMTERILDEFGIETGDAFLGIPADGFTAVQSKADGGTAHVTLVFRTELGQVARILGFDSERWAK